MNSGLLILLAISILLIKVLVNLSTTRKKKAWIGKAEAFVKRERWEDALAAANNALAIDPACAARRTKVVALAGLKRWDETLSAAGEALRVDAKDSSMLQHKIVALGKLNQWELAFLTANEALAVCPKNMWAWRERVRALGELQRWVLQLAAADQALAIDPQDGDIWYFKTEALEKLGRWTEALSASERTLELYKGAENWPYKFHKAQALDHLGRLEEAVAIYRQVAAANPDLDSTANLASALERLERTKVSPDPVPPRESLSNKTPTRVCISYERETASGDEIERVEIPFVVGVMADLQGNVPATGRFADRSFFDVLPGDFNACFKAVQPRLSITVTDAISDPPSVSGLQLDLKFESLADFTAERMIVQVPALAKRVLVRNLLQSLISCFTGVDGIGRALDDFEAMGKKLTPGSAEYEAWVEVQLFNDICLSAHDVPPLAKFQASIDRKLSGQLDAILHAPDFQRLEAAWRGLKYLVPIDRTMSQIRIRAINVSKKELLEDLPRAAEFDQSHVFKKVIQPLAEVRGEPFSLLIADYEFGASDDDLSVLRLLSQVADAAKAPLLAAAAPDLAGVNDFKELRDIRDLTRRMESPQLARWRSFRREESSRYVALTLPRVLMRLPYSNALNPMEAFEFEEKDVCLWGNGAYAVARRILISFNCHGWCAEICGYPHGLARDVPVQDGNNGLAWRGPAEIALGRERALELSRLGFIVIRQSEPEDERAVIDSVPTCHKPKLFDQEQANECARLSIDLRYILAMNRFMHFLAMRLRDRIGGFVATSELESFLNRSLLEYVAGSEAAVSPHFPLRSGVVHLNGKPDNPGAWQLVLFAKPAYQLQASSIDLRAALQVPPSREGERFQ
jgi:type VI secretion system protein ImpC